MSEAQDKTFQQAQAFSAMSYRQRLLALLGHQQPDADIEILYEDPWVLVMRAAKQRETLWLSVSHRDKAGAVDRRVGQALIRATEFLLAHASESKRVVIIMDSAGANLLQPLAGLFYLNTFLERLWQLKTSKLAIITVVPRHLFGGSALALATVTDHWVLLPDSKIGITGSHKKLPSEVYNCVFAEADTAQAIGSAITKIGKFSYS